MPTSVAEPRCPLPDSVGLDATRSRCQLQEYIQRFPRFLNEEIERQLPAKSRLVGQHTEWLSELESDPYRPGPSADFLRAAGLSDQPGRLDRRWSRLGACWDAVGLLPRGRDPQQGVLLVEAKSHLEEIDGPTSRLPAGSSPLIQATFHETRQWLNALETEDWAGGLYSAANRLAHLHLLRNHLGVPAWLVQVYFLNDPSGPASRSDWLPVIAGAHARLGLCRRPPFTLDVFLPALHPA